MATDRIASATKPAEDTSTALPLEQRKHWSMVWRSPLWLCLLLALVVRIVLIVHTNGVIDGDESLVGIQAQHILRGERPIYFYGIPYFGSLEAYLVALVFALAGSSVWALRAEPTLLAVLIVWLTWRLAAVLADMAGLPDAARRNFMLVAALLAAVFPLYDTVLEIRTFGGYVEIFALMQLLLLGTLQLTRHWDAGASKCELALRWAALGFIVGLGLWVDPLIIAAVVVTVLWIGVYCVFALRRLHRETPDKLSQGIFSLCKRLLLALATIPAALLGCAPALYWGANHQWQNVTYILNLGNGYASLSPAVHALYPTRLSLTAGLVKLYTTCVVPRIIGGSLPAESGRLLTTLHTFTLTLGVCCIVTTALLLALSFVVHHPLLTQVRQLTALPLLFAASTAFFFCTSTAAVAGLDCTRDLAGRYATPLMLALPFFFAATFTAIHLSAQHQTGQQAHEGAIEQRVVPTQNVYTRFWQRSATIVQVALFVVLFAYLGAQAATYRLTDAGHTFQSPYCTHALAMNAPIMAYLQQQHIGYAWAANWVGYPIIFKSGGSLTLADPQPAMKNMAYFNRFPADVTTVLHADRASFLVLVRHGDRHPQLLRLWDAEHISYHAVFFPSEPEADILLATPLSRTVSPFESEVYFALFHCSS